MKTLPISGSEPSLAPAIHLEFIRSVVESRDPQGAETVDSFHRSLFLHRHGAELARQEQDRRGAEERVAALESQLRSATQHLEAQDKFLAANDQGTPDDLPSMPWNLWSRLMFIASGMAILCLLAFGVFNVSFNLLESGIITFSEHPIRAYLWGALLPVGALAVKIGWDLLESRRARSLYVWLCLALGLAGIGAWATAYASIYPTLSKTTEEQIRSLNVFDSPEPALSHGAKTIDMVLVLGQATAEIFLSAVLGIYMSQLYARHRPVSLAMNPSFTPFDEERRSLQVQLQRERSELAGATGAITRLEHELAVFVAYARSLFLREQAALQDRGAQQRRIIEEAAHELRLRLAALDETTAAPSVPETNGSGSSFHPTSAEARS